MKLTPTAVKYLRAIDDWKAPFEVAAIFGWPECAGEKTKPYLGRLINQGLAKWHRGNNTYRITEAGKAALEGQKP